jgi:BASS family bile acid:Na+ symporter
MPAPIALLVSATIFTIMFSLGTGVNREFPSLLRNRPAFFWRVMLATCLVVPLLGLGLILLPLAEDFSRPAKFAIALMVACPSAPLTLFRVSRSRGIRALALRLQLGAAILSIVSVPLVATVFLQVKQIDGWEINAAEVASQIFRVQLIPLAAGMLLSGLRPAWTAAWQGVLDRLASTLLMVMVLVLLVITRGQLLAFLSNNGLALVAMAAMVALSLAIGYALASSNPLEKRTVSLLTGMRNTGLAVYLAVRYRPDMEGLIPGLISYVLINQILVTLFIKWQDGQIKKAAV